MLALYHACGKHISLVGLSVAGATASNAAQVLLARFFILGPNAIYIMPPFLLVGLVSGTALGLFCQRFADKSLWYAALTSGQQSYATTTPTPPQSPPSLATRANALFCIGLAGSIALLAVKPAHIRIALAAAIFLLAVLLKKEKRILLTLISFTTIALFNLFPAYGKVIAQLGPFTLASDSLADALKKAATIEALVMLSKLTVSNKLRLPGRFGALVSESFRILRILSAEKKRITIKNMIGALDALLLKAETL
jgi:hypothetical protein